MKYKDLLISSLEKIDLITNNEVIEKFEKYYELLIEWNNKFNLTTITDEKDVIIKHFVDSLLVVKSFDFSNIDSILDIGTGAGFPGIPLKIVYPEIKLVLIDSVNKKVTFLNEVCRQLDLNNTTCLHGRAEDYGHEAEYRESFDIVLSRAVSNLSTLSEYCMPFVKINGVFIAYKSADCNDELINAEKAIKTLGGYVKGVEYVKIPNTEIERTYIIVSKKSKVSEKYPRKAGLPSKKPL